jgi:hypothetical protein
MDSWQDINLIVLDVVVGFMVLISGWGWRRK